VGDYKEGGTKMTPKRIALLVCIVLFAAFIVQNAQVVEVRFLFWKTEASRALVLLGTLILGLISGWLFGRLRGKRPHPPPEE
jgi:putative membrane protein